MYHCGPRALTAELSLLLTLSEELADWQQLSDDVINMHLFNRLFLVSD